MTGIIGPNGAGKTTLFGLLAGSARPTGGQVLYEGRDVTRMPSYRRARLGLTRTFQLARPLSRMTVEENLLLAPGHQLGEHGWAPLLAWPRVREQERALHERVHEALAFFELEPLREQFAGALSGGQRKLLELARALLTEPKIVLLDEPMAGVNPALGRKVLDKIGIARRERGITFVLVEHDLETVFAHCQPIIVMANGKVLAQGSAKDIRANPHVVEAYLGA